MHTVSTHAFTLKAYISAQDNVKLFWHIQSKHIQLTSVLSLALMFTRELVCLSYQRAHTVTYEFSLGCMTYLRHAVSNYVRTGNVTAKPQHESVFQANRCLSVDWWVHTYGGLWCAPNLQHTCTPGNVIHFTFPSCGWEHSEIESCMQLLTPIMALNR